MFEHRLGVLESEISRRPGRTLLVSPAGRLIWHCGINIAHHIGILGVPVQKVLPLSEVVPRNIVSVV